MFRTADKMPSLEDIEAICASNEPNGAKLARQYGVSRTTIYRYRQGFRPDFTRSRDREILPREQAQIDRSERIRARHIAKRDALQREIAEQFGVTPVDRRFIARSWVNLNSGLENMDARKFLT